MYCGLSVKTITRSLKAAQSTKIVSAYVFAFTFACMGGKNLKIPKLRPMPDDAITRVGIGCLASLVYICGVFRFFADHTCIDKPIQNESTNFAGHVPFLYAQDRSRCRGHSCTKNCGYFDHKKILNTPNWTQC